MSMTVSQPFGMTTQPVVVALHNESVDALLRHRLAHGSPTAVKLAIRYRIEQPFIHLLGPRGTTTRSDAMIGTKPIDKLLDANGDRRIRGKSDGFSQVLNVRAGFAHIAG